MAFPLRSHHVKRTLERLHPNIVVIRHPKVSFFIHLPFTLFAFYFYTCFLFICCYGVLCLWFLLRIMSIIVVVFLAGFFVFFSCLSISARFRLVCMCEGTKVHDVIVCIAINIHNFLVFDFFITHTFFTEKFPSVQASVVEPSPEDRVHRFEYRLLGRS